MGVGFAHPRGAVTSIGPLAARPGAPGRRGARADGASSGGVAAQSSSLRLFQDSFNPDSFGLYARLGYVVADVAPYLLAEKLTPPGRAAPARSRAAPRRPAADRALRSRAHRRRPAARPRAAGVDRQRRSSPRARRSADRSPATSSTGRCRRGWSSARASPSRPRRWRDLVDGVAAALPGRAAVIRASAAAPSVLLRAFARGFRVDHLGNLMVAGPYTPPPAQLYALFPESL